MTDTWQDTAGRIVLEGTGMVGGLESVAVSLSSADILALFTTPFTLVAGQPGKLLIPVEATIVVTKGTTYYTVADQDMQIGIYIPDKGNGFPNFEPLLSSGSLGSRVFTDVFSLGKPANFVSFYGDPAIGGPDPLDWNEGQELVITLPSSDATGGDGTAVVDMLYRAVSVS